MTGSYARPLHHRDPADRTAPIPLLSLFFTRTGRTPADRTTDTRKEARKWLYKSFGGENWGFEGQEFKRDYKSAPMGIQEALITGFAALLGALIGAIVAPLIRAKFDLQRLLVEKAISKRLEVYDTAMKTYSEFIIHLPEKKIADYIGSARATHYFNKHLIAVQQVQNQLMAYGSVKVAKEYAHLCEAFIDFARTRLNNSAVKNSRRLRVFLEKATSFEVAIRKDLRFDILD